MTLLPKEITNEIEQMKPQNFEQAMQGILTILLVGFVLFGIAAGREIPEWLIGVSGTVIGVWFQRKTN